MALLDRENDRETIASIVHDVAVQRTVPDVMTFLRGVRDQPDIVKSLLIRFTDESSGRSDFDKVQLCSSLRADVGFQKEEQRHEYAHQTLGRALHIAYRRDSRSDTRSDVNRAQLYNIPAALQHVDRGLTMLCTWITTEVNRNVTPDHYADLYTEQQDRVTVDQIAAWAMTRTLDGEGTDDLIRLAVERLPAHHVGLICEELAKLEGVSGRENDNDGQFRMLWRAFATDANIDRISALLRQLDDFPSLNSESDALLTEIVEMGGSDHGGDVRSVASLRMICKELSRSRNEALALALRRIAVERLTRRPAQDVPALVKLASSAREQRQLERLAGVCIATATLEVTAPADKQADWCADVIQALEQAELSLAATATLRELSEPDRFDAEAAERIAAVAERIYRASGLAGQAFYLLERTLENEQGGRGTQRSDVVARTVTIIKAVAAWLPKPRRQELVQATVGRWSDTQLRYETARRLDTDDPKAASWIYDVLERRRVSSSSSVATVASSELRSGASK